VAKSNCKSNIQKAVSLRRMFSSMVLLALLAAGTISAQEVPTVLTTAGQLRGLARAGGGAKFLGVPFAQPPVGDLRWREPLAAKSWSGMRDATAFGAPCAQPVLGDWNRHDAEAGKED
jgi:para-nitrobenzyl esterase